MIAARKEQAAADYQLQLEINQALASGNTEAAKGLEYKREHSRLTEKILRDTTMTEEQARALATKILDSKIAADAAAEAARRLKDGVRGAGEEGDGLNETFKSVRQTMTDIENAKLEAAPQRLKERTADARTELKSMADFIGQDLSKMSLDNILEKLGFKPENFSDTNEKLSLLEDYLKELGDADPADITPEVNPDDPKAKTDAILEYIRYGAKKKEDITPTLDQAAVEAAVDAAKKTIADGLTRSPIDVNLNAEESIGKIREQLKEEIDLGIQSAKGTEHLSSIDKLVIKIESLVSKISEKLPMQALSY
jgi:hypothetical protein